ncbi:MAG: NAD(P)/FAD-dependent oxidoreductase [Acidobacteria bacterium]|nr:MAG: NAD(P)/FAD-dependent oxidoreductase [Acidobacteriota bacterium]REK08920.1 MAG: NAD(P)/FAD-dependent oxidoreductase [Acidobacteriota bacterium]
MQVGSTSRPRVLVIGGGFGGLAVARGLARAPVEVLLVDRSNHHLFQPLLYQVATAGLSPADIARPLREVLRRQKNATVLMAEVTAVDAEARLATLDGGQQVPFDYCVLAVGARHSYFGNDGWERHAPGLKTLGDALDVRSRTLRSFERAERAAASLRAGELEPGGAEDPADRTYRPHDAEPPTFVVVGAGPTGVEMAGALIEIAQRTMRRNFRRIAPQRTRVVLVEALDSVLSNYPEELRESARRQLEGLGVEVLLSTRVTAIDEDGVTVERVGAGADASGEAGSKDSERLVTRNVVWAAGNEVPPLVRETVHRVGGEVDRAGRARVESDLSLPGAPHLFVIGDAARLEDEEGELVPGVAPAAMQAGQSVADSIRADLAGRQRKPFRYWNRGTMATIGRARAVAWIGRLRFGGLLAWLAWSLIHIFFLIGYRNRVVVMLEWFVLYLTGQRAGRLLYDRSGVVGGSKA